MFGQNFDSDKNQDKATESKIKDTPMVGSLDTFFAELLLRKEFNTIFPPTKNSNPNATQ
jgi:hypothetical protein